MNIVIVGAGKIGVKRADSMLACGDKLVGVVDVSSRQAENFAAHYSIPYSESLSTMLKDADVVVVSTPPHAMYRIVLEALEAGKHVLCEKPFCMNYKEAKSLADLSLQKNLKVKVGFNHRYHPHIQYAHRLISKGVIGDVMYAKLTFGHGARLGYEKEWWSDPHKIGGGCLMDGGSHALDLLNWFFGEPVTVKADVFNSYWATRPLEDNAMLILLYSTSIRAFVHISTTQWKNKFEMEVYGSKGYIRIEGLGKSYGPERLIVGKSIPGQVLEEIITDFTDANNSFLAEWIDFKTAIIQNCHLGGDAWSGVLVQEIIRAAYESVQEAKEVLV